MPTPHSDRSTLITSQLFESYLACPTKCYLQAIGEPAPHNDFAAWHDGRRRSYYLDRIRSLKSEHSRAVDWGGLDPSTWKQATWDFAFSPVVRTQHCEVHLHAVQRVKLHSKVLLSEFIPLHFVPENKLSRSEKLVVAFEAFVLANAGATVRIAKITHGDNQTTVKLQVDKLFPDVRKTVHRITGALSSSSPPELVLKDHCRQCDFQRRCRIKATETNDLSLLANMSETERARLNKKGVFTVDQLSYTFRPRRRSRRCSAKSEKYHHSLKALAIREKKIHVVGDPQFRIDGTPVYLDVESIPDLDTYYLIGVRVEENQGIARHSLWVDKASDEERNWRAFIDILSHIDRPVLIHYGSFETTFIKRMCARYGGPPEGSAAANAIAASVNILSLIFAQVYFPTYSNGLKEIARFLGYEWSDPSSSGLQSVVWRHDWELSADPGIRAKLTAYNMEDCDALCLVAQVVGHVSRSESEGSTTSVPPIVHLESVGKALTSNWRPFKSPLLELEIVNKAARWNYQRDRVFVRSGIAKKRKSKRPAPRTTKKKPEIQIVLEPPTSCPSCGKRGRIRSRLRTRTVRDLVFGKGSVKGRLVRYVFQTYICRSCLHEYNVPKSYLMNQRKWGWNILAYFVYHMAGLSISRGIIRKSTAKYYEYTKLKILDRLIHGNLIHADETRANIKGRMAYVWVLTNLKEVVHILAESREGKLIQGLLKEFNGVLVSDFYAPYNSIDCPQQKCLIHLMRDLNDELLNNPFDAEIKSITTSFGALLKPMIDTIDRRGLRKRSLRKHAAAVKQFYECLDKSEFRSESAIKCQQRFQKNRNKLFTFLHYDDVPWNNNNAEHAIKAFARLRDVIAGSSSKIGVDEYLTLLTVAQTCEYQGLDFLGFLRSRETDVETFAGRQPKRRRTHVSPDLGKVLAEGAAKTGREPGNGGVGRSNHARRSRSRTGEVLA